jgi:hypothetical protein
MRPPESDGLADGGRDLRELSRGTAMVSAICDPAARLDDLRGP